MVDPCDLILSDVHLGDLAQETGHVIAGTSYQAYRSEYRLRLTKFVQNDDNSLMPVQKDQRYPTKFDSDGDVLIVRRKCPEITLKIEHAMLTTLEDVGLQIWNGAVLLSEFILSNPHIFQEKVILELGCGLGLSSLCLALSGARYVYATDISQPCLHLCQFNVSLNTIKSAASILSYKRFDWTKNFDLDSLNAYDWSSGSQSVEKWTNQELERAKNVDVIVAADVIYDLQASACLYKRLIEFGSLGSKQIYISLEKRYNFTLENLHVVCPAYEKFQKFLTNLSEDLKWCVNRLDLGHVPQLFDVPRNDQTVSITSVDFEPNNYW